MYYRTIKVNEDKHEVDRTSANENQIDDVTFLETPLIPTRSKEEAIMKVEIRKKIVRRTLMKWILFNELLEAFIARNMIKQLEV